MVDFYGKLVGKYAVRPMDPMGYDMMNTFSAVDLRFIKTMVFWALKL